MEGQQRGTEVSELLARTRRQMKQWGITVSYLARQMGVSRQYTWQVVHQRTVVSEERAKELGRSVEAIIRGRKHLATFGDRLRAARVAAGFTLKQVAALIGYSWVGVERWERDVCLPKPGVLWHLLSLYGVDQSSFETVQVSHSSSTPRGSSGHGGLGMAFGVREELALSLRATGGISNAAWRFQRSHTWGIPATRKANPRASTRDPL
jgi:transcriptional regulator with XRE-family HTH domain